MVGELQCRVFTLFGKVIGQIEEPDCDFHLNLASLRPHTLLRKKVRPAPPSKQPAWPNGQFRRHAHGGRNLVRNGTRSCCLLVRECESRGSLQVMLRSTISTLSNLEMDMMSRIDSLSRTVRENPFRRFEKAKQTRLSLHSKGLLYGSPDGDERSRKGRKTTAGHHDDKMAKSSLPYLEQLRIVCLRNGGSEFTPASRDTH